jgi:hypothetical protein
MEIDHDQGRAIMSVALKHSSICEIAVAVNEDQPEMQEPLRQPTLQGSSSTDIDQEISSEELAAAMLQEKFPCRSS